MKGALSKIDIKNRSIVLPAILLLGLFFRLYDLGGESLWLDEASSVKYAQLNVLQIFFQQKETPPLYYLILHWWTRLFGISEFSVRFPSVLFGCLSVFIMYMTGRQLFDKAAGKMSALLMAVSLFHIQYSQEARTYSLSVLLTLLSMHFFIKLVKDARFKNFLGYMLSSILLMYSHIYGLFIIIAQNIYFVSLSLLSREARDLDVKRWFAIQFALIILFVPWVSIFFHKVAEVQKGYWIKIPDISTIISSFKEFSSGSILLLLLFLALSLFSLISFEKLQSSQREIRALNTGKIYFLLIWLLTPVILPFIISRFSQPIYQTKYTIVASSAFYLLIASGISNVHSKHVKSFAIGIVIILSLLSVRGYYAGIKKEPWRKVAEYIDSNAHNGDMVLINAPYCMQPFNYYSRNGLIVKKGFPEKDRKVDENNITKLSETVKHHDRIWLILAHSGDNNELISKALSASYNLSLHKKYYYSLSKQKNISLYLFDKGHTHAVSRLSGS